jgi:hypothetical protein
LLCPTQYGSRHVVLRLDLPAIEFTDREIAWLIATE